MECDQSMLPLQQRLHCAISRCSLPSSYLLLTPQLIYFLLQSPSCNNLFYCEMGLMKKAQINSRPLGQPKSIPANSLSTFTTFRNAVYYSNKNFIFCTSLLACLLCCPFDISYSSRLQCIKSLSYHWCIFFLLNEVYETKDISNGYLVFLVSQL